MTDGSPGKGRVPNDRARVRAAVLPGSAAVALAATLAASAAALAAFPDGPPARVTGGFGEDSCAACHFTFDDAPETGRLDVAGFPDCYLEGEGYDLVVRLEDRAMAVAGFQLAVRAAADTTQAGGLAAGGEDGDRVAIQLDRGVAFAQHTLDGSTTIGAGKARWHVRWTAPAGPRPVVLHVAALAGDGDRSQEGDRTYTLEQVAGGKGCH